MKKKFLSLLCAAAFAIALPFAFVGCKKDDKTTIRINEVTHSVFYAPLYLADALGYFADEGYKIELTNGGGADKTMAAVLNGSAEIGFCGPEAVVYTYLGGSGDAPKVFGQMTNCDGSFLVGRKAEPDFKWSNLEGKNVLAGRPGGVPFMTFQYICREQNVKANFITDVKFDSMTAAFSNGVGDYVTMFEPSASEFEKSGKGYIVAPVGPAGGEVPYTCFMAKESFIEKESGKVDVLLRSVTKATKYIYEHDINDVADKIAKYFDATSKESVAVSLKNYKSINTWVKNMAMTESRFNRLQDIIQSAGELEKRVNFTDIVLTQRADEIYQEVYA